MRKFLITIGLLLPIASWADSLGFEVGATLWRTEMEGLVDVPIRSDLSLSVDLEKNLEMNTTNSQQYYFELYHPLPYLPNIILASHSIEHAGDGSPLLSDIMIGTSSNIKINLNGTLNIDHYDVTGYWTPLNLDFLSLDAGITYRKFDGSMNFFLSGEGVALPIKSIFDKQYLLAYGKITAYLPLIGLSAHFKLNAGHNFNTNTPEQAFDMDVGVTYRTLIGLGVSAGYRYFDVDLEANTQVSSSITKKTSYKLDTYGPYLSLSYRL